MNGPPIDNATLVHIGPDALVLIRPVSREVIVTPTDHVATLGDIPDWKLGELLGALRRATTVLQINEGDVTAERAKDLVGAEGHLCVRIFREPPGEGPGPFGDIDSLTRRLREVMS